MLLNVARLYVGLISADDTFKLTPSEAKAKAIALTNERFLGFTVVDSLGYWQGNPEPSIIITIGFEGDGQDVVDLAKTICVYLKQQSVALEPNGVMKFIE